MNRPATGAAALAGLVLLAACRTTPAPVAAVNPAGVRTGQAVWRPAAGAGEVAGELLVVTQADGALLVEFAKPPHSLAQARLSAAGWELTLPGRRPLRGRGAPPVRPVWPALLTWLRDGQIPAGWQADGPAADGSWRLDNEATGERLEGFLSP